MERLVIDIVFKITCEWQIKIEKKKKKDTFSLLRKIIV
jgi:hypothetical protein